MTTELIPAQQSICEEDRRFAVCYARGSVFKREGHFLKVEKGARTVVQRALCLTAFFGSRCAVCPNGSLKVHLEVSDGLPPSKPK